MNIIRRLALAACAVASFANAHAGNQFVRINEIMAGLNADAGIQFVELVVRDEAQKQWGPRGAETAGRVTALPFDDPLFVMDANVNTLVLGGVSQPSDFALRGVIRGTLGGTAKVLAGSGATYQIIGGSTLAIAGNVIADARGNRGTFASFTAGNLAGPTPTNADPFGIERNDLLRSPAVLILENINGFTQTAFMRTVPSVMNVKYTAPYGWSGDFPDLESLTVAAIAQHTPRRLERAEGTDFRAATAAELAAITAFQNDLNLPANENFDEVNRYGRFLTTAQQRTGRDLFLGAVAKCAACHGGKTLSQSDGRFGTVAGVNQSFNTGVHNQPQDAGLPTEQNLGAPANSRAFSVPALMGVGKTEPFFHDGVFTGGAQFAPFFYAGAEFAASPAAATVGPIILSAADVANIGAFLNAVGEEPQAPVIAGVVGVQNQLGAASLRPFPNVTVSDATVPAQTLTVTVALDDAAKGTLSALGNFTLTAPGTWTFPGTAAAATTALRALVFDHAPGRTPVGLTERTRFTLGVNDGVATTLFNDTTTIVSTTVATPALTTIAALTTLNTGASIPVAFSIAGLDTAASDFTLTASSSTAGVIAPGAIAFGGTGTTRTITLTPAAGVSGVTTITLTAAQGGQTILRTFEVTVVPFAASISAGVGAHNFTFTAQPGQKYAIEKSASLTAPIWVEEKSVIATQSTMATTVIPGGATQMFYRARLLP